MTRVFLSLGSNLGNSQKILSETVKALKSDLGDLRFSQVYRSSPLYNTQQPEFLNQVVSGLFPGAPEELLTLCQELESRAQRVRGVWKGPRTLDVDIILFGTLILDSPRLTLPHPGLEERAFVLLPLVELQRDLVNPRTGRALIQVLDTLPDQGVVPLG